MSRNTGFSPKVRQQLEQRSGGVCEICGNSAAEQAHHRRPRGAGGTRRAETNYPSNALMLCAACHLVVETGRSESYRKGWVVRQQGDPAEVPVRYRDGQVYLLANDGGMSLYAEEEL
jgi:hypothetical protein